MRQIQSRTSEYGLIDPRMFCLTPGVFRVLPQTGKQPAASTDSTKSIRMWASLRIFGPNITGTMEIFYTQNIDGRLCRLDETESAHCIKVLRHRRGDRISVIDGKGNMMECRLVTDSPRGAEAEILETVPDWGGHPYRLHLAVCPTKNIDRYEWFAEKACEIGVDTIIPTIGEHSERKVFKTGRLEKILVSAAKQSLKGAVPAVTAPIPVRDFITEYGQHGTAPEEDTALRLIAYCFEDDSHPRVSIKEALSRYIPGDTAIPEIYVMIGPEGDFSKEEAALAFKHGFIPVHLGPSRLRTETAAVTAAEAVYFRYM